MEVEYNKEVREKMNLKIAICDDEYNVQCLIEDLLKQILQDYNIENEIEIYSNGEEFCRHFAKSRFDLIFLDIELQGMNGVQVGHFIREKERDEEVQIAYVSGNIGYALELFEYRPINFLVKPVKMDDIKHVIDKYLILNSQGTEVFRYKKKTEYFRIALGDVAYFSSSGRKVMIHQMHEEDEFYGTLDQVYNQVKGKRFLFVHKSYIINCNYIKHLEYDKVTLLDGTIIPISQSRRVAIRKQFLGMKREEL